MSIAFAAVDVAVLKYDSKKNNSFYSYWQRIATNSMKAFVKKQLQSHIGSEVSLDAQNEFGGTLHDVIASDAKDEGISLRNSLMTIINDERRNFSEMERKIISLFLDGFEIKEISKILKVNKAKVYRDYHSAINKIRRSIIDKK